MKKTAVIICLLGIAGVSFFVGLTDTPDSYQYFALGKYLYSKEVLPQAPFNYDRPRTLFGPLYALFATPLYQLPVPMGALLIPFIQLILLGLSAVLLYKSVEYIFHKPWPLVTAIIFLLLPYNLIYATFMMSETLTQFFIACFLFTISRYRNRAPRVTFSLLTLFGALATLTRFGFLFLFAGSLIGWAGTFILPHIRKIRSHTGIYTWLPACIGVATVAIWILFNRQINGVWTLSSYTGRHLYDNVVTDGKLLPDLNDSAIAPFLASGHSPGEMTSMAWWDTQSWFAGAKINDEEVDRLFFKLSLAAIRKHPVEYIAHSIRSVVLIPLAQPYTRENFVRDFASCRFAACQDCVPMWSNNFTCWTKPICTPPLVNCSAQSSWAGFAGAQDLFYPTGAAILLAIAFIGMITTVLFKNKLLRWIAVIFLILLGFHAATELIQGRFILPLYPFYAVLLVYPVSILWNYVLNKILSKRIK